MARSWLDGKRSGAAKEEDERCDLIQKVKSSLKMAMAHIKGGDGPQ